MSFSLLLSNKKPLNSHAQVHRPVGERKMRGGECVFYVRSVDFGRENKRKKRIEMYKKTERNRRVVDSRYADETWSNTMGDGR